MPIGKKISEKIITRLEPQIEKASQTISEGVATGVKDFFTKKGAWGREFTDWIRKGWRFITGEMILDPEVAKRYPLLHRTEIQLNLTRAKSEVEMSRIFNDIFSAFDWKKDIPPAERMREVLRIFQDADKLLEKFLDERIIMKEDLSTPLNELRKRIIALEPDQLQALKNRITALRAVRATLEEKERQRITMETIYPDAAKYGLKLARDKGYLGELEKMFRNTFGIDDLKLEDIYFTQLSPEYYRVRYGLDRLTPLMPKKIAEKKSFMEKARYFSIWKAFEDPLEAEQFFWRTFYFDRRVNKTIQETLFDGDILKKLSPQEIKKLTDYTGDFGQNRTINREMLKKAGLTEILEKIPADEEGVILKLFTTGPENWKISQSERALLNLMAEGKTDRELLDIGIRRRVYLLPVSYERAFTKLLESYGGTKGWISPIEDLIAGIRYPVTFWKKLVTLYLGGIPFQTMNAVGDLYRMVSFAPEATRKLGMAARVLWDYNIKGDIKGIERRYGPQRAKEIIKLIDETSFAYVDYVTDVQTPFLRSIKERPPGSPLNIWYWIDDTLQMIYQFRESVPKLSVALWNLDRVKAGLLPKFRGSPSWIKSMYDAGYIYEAIGTYGRYVTVDYAAMNPAFRRIFSNMIAPFAFWYMRNFKSLLDYSIQTKGIAPALSFGIPIAILYLFNNREGDPKAREYEEHLPDWVRYSMHINVEVPQSIKKMFNLKQDYMTINFQTPWDVAAQFIGIDKVWKLFDQWRDNKITDEYFKEAIVYSMLMEAPTETALGLLNPVIKSFIDIRANRDIYTGRKIVPDRLVGTPQAMQHQIAHFLGGVSLTPLIPMMGMVNQADMDVLLREIDKRGLDTKWKTALQVLWEQLKRPIDIKKAMAIRDYDWSNFAKRDIYENYEIQKRNFEDYMERVMTDLLKGNIEGFNKRIEDIKLGNVPGVEPELAADYFNRADTMKRIIRRAAELKLPPEKREQIERLLNMFDIKQKLRQMNKGFRNQTTESLQEYFESLLEQ